MFTLETINAGSSELLSKLCTETFLQAYDGVHSTDNLHAYCHDNYSVNATKALLDQNNVEAVIAFEKKEAAGFYVLKHHQCPIELTGHSTELKQIYVLSNHFGSGLGRKLFSDAVNQAINNKSKWLWLCVSDINYRAQGFYKKLGFKKVGNGPELVVGDDTLSSSIMILNIEAQNQ
ncbi:GNAT family N-acetyltransferase [Thalassomonas viridans]|uniref:GNAT family N-acetyltransferase n=1 Tax=Thalassomonas viridans TaxID=137584 RepID=A0AAF0CDD3_9GAMM|nr:GNAT family N-acetyltransferase [Thalassomonas viridans]WDE08716.1 GNAT family N-acetyltransferase [Thalassomonas viridans]